MNYIKVKIESIIIFLLGILFILIATSCAKPEEKIKTVEIDTKTYNYIDTYDPCGDDIDNPDEILLLTMSGEVLAYFEDGGKRFLAVLEEGNYQTTDKQKCNFSINSEGEINE